MLTHEEVALQLVTPLWRGLNPDYKRKYARSIWPQFEDNLRSAAYTARLSTFLAKITQRLSIDIHREDTERVTTIVQSGTDKATLKMLREDTTLLVLLVRVANEERKAKFEAKKKTEKKESEKEGESLFSEEQRVTKEL